MPRGTTSKTTLAAFAGAALLHAALLPIAFDLGSARDAAPAPEEESSPPGTPRSDPAAAPSAAVVALVSEADLGDILRARVGPFDAAREGDTNPVPNSDADRSGLEAVSVGGELEGGVFRESLRRDHEDQRAEIWNGNPRAQQAIEAHRATDRAVASPEAVTRQRRPEFDSSSDGGKRARVSATNPRSGDKTASDERDHEGTRVPVRDWRTDPLLDTMVATARDAGRKGRVSKQVRSAISDRGSESADVPRRGRLVGALDSAAASEETNPAPFELSQSGSGGTASGVAGDEGFGRAKDGAGEGTASSTRARPGKAGESIRASRSDPYFRGLYRRLDREVQFPRDLAVNLEQGTVVAHFTLNPDGVVSGIKVAKTSGFRGFDRALTVALRKAGPFGKVPTRLLQGARSIRIVAPYRFSNPLIR